MYLLSLGNNLPLAPVSIENQSSISANYNQVYVVHLIEEQNYEVTISSETDTSAPKSNLKKEAIHP